MEMESEKTLKSAKGEAATTTQWQFTAERHSETHVGSPEGKEIDTSYYTLYCMLDEEGLTVPGPQPLRFHRRPPQVVQQDQAHDVALFDMRDMYMSLMEAKMEALYKGEQALLMTLSSAFLERQFMSQDDFIAHVAWPTDQAQASGGVGASEAATMEEKDDDDKDQNEDKEEEEDEEDEDDDEESDNIRG
ncbi:hypothetical protein LR48_Vigan115s001500 [Vigna angularis]|uniref:Uncharacterized protein n=1 Tax=Phaseolus angularis TaxID=3914 RepID=A0A0L9T4M1_PHAAN|nr:hypothetical protein LR48_Vigan115s001500 [Vigna angularis]